MENLSSYLRIWQIIGSKNRNIQSVIPISRSTWLAGVKSGRFPAPLKIGRCVVWRAEDIATFIQNPNSYKQHNEAQAQ